MNFIIFQLLTWFLKILLQNPIVTACVDLSTYLGCTVQSVIVLEYQTGGLQNDICIGTCVCSL